MRALIAVAATVLLAAGCGGEDKPTETEKQTGGGDAVEMVDFAFEPSRLEVEAGSTVEWTNAGEQIHNVRQASSSGEKFFSRAVEPGGKYTLRLSRQGDYEYLCTLHPQMTGTISVR